MKRKGHTRKKEDLNERRRKSFLTTILMEVIGCMIGGLMLAYMTAGGEWGFENGAFVFSSPFYYIRKGAPFFWLGIVAAIGLVYYSWTQYERIRNTRTGEEHGTSSLMKGSDMPGFNQSFFYDPAVVAAVTAGKRITLKRKRKDPKTGEMKEVAVGFAYRISDEERQAWEKKNTFYNDEELKKVCKSIPKTQELFRECFLKSQILGQDVYLSMNCKFISRNLNSITIGSSGQGKTYSELLPNALNANANYIFTDPSGEILQKVGKYLKSQGYRLIVFNVDEFDKSMKYNPLRYVEDSKDYNTLVDVLNKNIKGGRPSQNTANEFFDDAKDSLMCALFALLRELYPVSDDIPREQREKNLRKQSLKNVMRLLLMAEQEVKKNEQGKAVGTTSTLDDLFQKLSEHDTRSYAYAQWKSFKVGGEKVCNEVIISAAAVFGRFFNTDALEWLTAYDELKLYDLASEKKCALFIVTPQDTTTYNFMAAMVYSQLFGIVMKAGKYYRDQRGTDNPALPRHLSFWLDEFANIGKIPNFLELLSVVRKYNISINIIIQGMAQLKGMYPKEEWEVILANLDTMIYLGGMEPGTVKWLSEKLGKATIKQITSNKNAKSSGESYSNLGRALMTPDEIEQMARAHELVFISGCKPIRTRKYDLSKHPHYRFCGEADKRNNYNIRSLVPHQEIDYDLLDEAALTVQKIKEFDFNGLPIEKGHKKGYVIPDKWRGVPMEKLVEACNACKIPIKEKGEAVYYIKLLDEHEKKTGKELNPKNPLEGILASGPVGADNKETDNSGIENSEAGDGETNNSDSLSPEAQKRIEQKLKESTEKLDQDTGTAFTPYLAALQKHLSGQDKESRREIIEEDALSLFYEDRTESELQDRNPVPL